MENKATWICECGRKTVQLLNTKIIEKCECGRELKKLEHPDGVIQEFVKAEDWFVKEFDEQNRKLAEVDIQLRQAWWHREQVTRKINELVDKIEQGRRKMQNIVEHGARRMKLLKRQDMKWNFDRNICRFIGTPKEKK